MRFVQVRSSVLWLCFPLLVAACSGEPETPRGSGGGGSGGHGEGGGEEGGGGSGGGESCPPSSSPSCCPGDGTCCDCVSGHVCTSGPFEPPSEAAQAFDACACREDICGPTCKAACEGGGIDAGCQACVTAAAEEACATEFAACPSQGT